MNATVKGRRVPSRFAKLLRPSCDLLGMDELPPSYEPVRLRLPMPPSANDYWMPVVRTARVKGKLRTWAELVLTKEARRYKKAVAAEFRGRVRPIAGPVEISLVVHFSNERSDLTNRIKVLEDALQTVAFENDRQTKSLHIRQGSNAPEPYVEVWVDPLGQDAFPGFLDVAARQT